VRSGNPPTDVDSSISARYAGACAAN
jgi:hypothetical protein